MNQLGTSECWSSLSCTRRQRERSEDERLSRFLEVVRGLTCLVLPALSSRLLSLDIGCLALACTATEELAG